MFSKNNIKYILILGIGFLWCSFIYLTQEMHLLNYMTDLHVNIVDMLFGSFAMALGIFIFSVLYKKNRNVKKIYILFSLISILLSISFYLIEEKITLSCILCLICFLGTAGYGVGYHFSLVSSNVEKEYRGRVFAIGYTIGSIETYLITLLPSKLYETYYSLIFSIPLILLNIILINKYGNLKQIKEEKSNLIQKKYIYISILLILLMAIVTSFSSNMFALKALNVKTNFAYSRVYYAIGLIIAGYLADKKNEYIEVATIISLFYPLIAPLLLKEKISFILLYSLNYMFLGFFAVFRTTLFMNLKEKRQNYIYLAGFGLMISRIVEGLLVWINLYLNFNYLFLIISSIVVLSIILTIYLLYYPKRINKSNEDIIKEISVEYKLSSQESRVLELLVNDFTNQEIADKLFISINTVRNHIANIYKKTDMKKVELKEKCVLKTI